MMDILLLKKIQNVNCSAFFAIVNLNLDYVLPFIFFWTLDVIRGSGFVGPA